VSITAEIARRPVMFYLLIFLLRGGTSYVLAKEIISFRESRLKDIDLIVTNQILDVTQTPHWSIKLFCYSVIIMGIPLIHPMKASDLFHSQSMELNHFLVLFIVIDITRMYVLTLIVPWIISKRNHKFLVKNE